MEKKKTYVITVSDAFMKGHPRAGEPTRFPTAILRGLGRIPKYKFSDCNIGNDCRKSAMKPCLDPVKIHTIRENGNYWKPIIKEVQEGRAILSLRGWEGKPYASKQYIFATLDEHSGLGVQDIHIDVHGPLTTMRCVVDGKDISPFLVAEHDALSLEDFADWFLPDLTGSKEGVIIHFTNFRY